MQLDLVIAVWGDWHLDALERATLPTCLAPGNLPALARRHDCRLRIFTRRADRARIEAMPALARIRATMPVEVVAMTKSADVAAPFHLQWWRAAGTDAAERGAMVINLPPDVIFPEGCLVNLCEPLGQGKKAVLAPPQLRVVSETVLPAIAGLIDERGAAALSAHDTVGMGMRHLHPLFAQVVDGNPHGRPGIEFLWPVADEGFLLCQTAREIIAYDPARCTVSERFLEESMEDLAEFHVSASAEDTFFLSLAPLMKDFGLLLPDFPVTAKFLARWSTHPDNDTPLSRVLPRILVRLAARPPTPQRWREAEGTAMAWVDSYFAWRDVYRVWRDGKAAGCVKAGEIIGLAASVIDLAALFPCREAATVFLPADTAFGPDAQAALRPLLATGAEADLARLLRAHVAAGDLPPPAGAGAVEVETLDRTKRRLLRRADGTLSIGDIGVRDPMQIGRVRVYVVDKLLG